MRELALAQRRAGVEAFVLAGSSEPDRGESATTQARLDDVPVTRLPSPARHADLALVGTWAEGRQILLRQIDEIRPDVAHVHHWHNLTTDSVETCVDHGVHAIVTLHDFLCTCPLFFRLPDHATPCAPELSRDACVGCLHRVSGEAPATLNAALERREDRFRTELEKASAVLALSATQREFLARVPRFAGLEIRTVPLPSPVRFAASADRLFPAGHGVLRVVSWGGLDPGKGMRTLVEAVEHLPQPERVFVDHFGRVLDPSFRDRLQQTARRHRLTFHGPYDREAAETRFGAYDVAVFPSNFLETHGFVVDEALDLGLPVIVSDRGAPKLRVGGRGRVFPAGEPGALASILLELLDHPTRLAEMRKADRVSQPTMEEHERTIREIYQAAISPTSSKKSNESTEPTSFHERSDRGP